MESTFSFTISQAVNALLTLQTNVVTECFSKEKQFFLRQLATARNKGSFQNINTWTFTMNASVPGARPPHRRSAD